MHKAIIAAVVILLADQTVRAWVDVSTATRPPSANWPRWRGPDANGVADDQNLPIRWSPTENIVWSAKLPGWGTSSPVVYGDRVFVTSQDEQTGKTYIYGLPDPPAWNRTISRAIPIKH